MLTESALLKDAPYPEVTCPRCGVHPVEPFVRGQVQRRDWAFEIEWRSFDVGFMRFKWPRPWIRKRPYCAIICSNCHEILGYEAPTMEDWERYQRQQQEQFEREYRQRRAPDVIIIDPENGTESWAKDVSSSASMVHNIATSSVGMSLREVLDERQRRKDRKAEDNFNNSGCS